MRARMHSQNSEAWLVNISKVAFAAVDLMSDATEKRDWPGRVVPGTPASPLHASPFLFPVESSPFHFMSN